MLFEHRIGCFDFSRKDCFLFGILNVTPDSFSDGGKYVSVGKAVEHALALARDGANVLDIGGESSRPGAEPVSGKEEIQRVIPVLRALKKKLKIPISIDTTKAAVAEAAVEEGAAIINDISGLKDDSRMAGVAVESGTGVILMHKRGTPRTMKKLAKYKNLVGEVKKELGESLRLAKAAGIPSQKVAIDPGIGFAKTREQNLELLQRLKEFSSFGRPMMIGVSRKSFLVGGHHAQTPSDLKAFSLQPKSLAQTDSLGRGVATLAAEMWAWLQGAQMIRTHDVAATRQALETLKAISLRL